jgi:hypothetical protein
MKMFASVAHGMMVAGAIIKGGRSALMHPSVHKTKKGKEGELEKKQKGVKT